MPCSHHLDPIQDTCTILGEDASPHFLLCHFCDLFSRFVPHFLQFGEGRIYGFLHSGEARTYGSSCTFLSFSIWPTSWRICAPHVLILPLCGIICLLSLGLSFFFFAWPLGRGEDLYSVTKSYSAANPVLLVDE